MIVFIFVLVVPAEDVCDLFFHSFDRALGLELCPRLVRHCAGYREVKLFDNIDELQLLVFTLVTAECVTNRLSD